MSFLRKAAGNRSTEPAPPKKESLLERSRRQRPQKESLAGRARQLETTPRPEAGAPATAAPPAPAAPSNAQSEPPDGADPAATTAAATVAQIITCAEAGLRGPLAGGHLAHCLATRLPGATVVAFAPETNGGPLTPLASVGRPSALIENAAIDPENAAVAPSSELAATGAAVLSSRKRHATYAPLFVGVDTAAAGEWGLLSCSDAGVLTLLVAMWQAPSLVFAPPCSEPTESLLAALATGIAGGIVNQVTPPQWRMGDAALRQPGGGARDAKGVDGAPTADTVRLDATSLLQRMSSHLPGALAGQLLRRVQLAAATSLCRLGPVAPTEVGVAVTPQHALDLELIHRRASYGLRRLTAGIPGTEGAALLAMTKLTADSDAGPTGDPIE